MKKFVTTLLLCVLSAVMLFAFTACNNDENDKQNDTGDDQTTVTGNTVTEEQWKEALKFLVVEDGSTKENLVSDVNFNCIFDMTQPTRKYIYEVKINNKNKALYSKIDNDEYGFMQFYYWQDGNTYYTANADGSGKTSEELQPNGEFGINYMINNHIYTYCGGAAITLYKVSGNYSKFVYDETKKTYSATLTEGVSAEFTLAFDAGKLVKLKFEVKDTESINIQEFTFTYEPAVTVPAAVLSAQVSE